MKLKIRIKIDKALDGYYTRMFQDAFDISWKSHITNKELYGDLPKITTNITESRLRFAEHWKKKKKKKKESVVSSLTSR